MTESPELMECINDAEMDLVVDSHRNGGLGLWLVWFGCLLIVYGIDS